MNIVQKDTEFEITPFARYYEELSDSFINMNEVVNSFAALVPSGASVFELGLGTGYFASKVFNLGYKLSGIQPEDEMLLRLKSEHPEIRIVGQSKLEDYEFTDRHDFIVSHSSVFLFTEHFTLFGKGETRRRLVFQSFIKDEAQVYSNVEKVLEALNPCGCILVNIQTNPPVETRVGPADDQVVFEMTECVYDFEMCKVQKRFVIKNKGNRFEVLDERFCTHFNKFREHLTRVGGTLRISPDRRWIILSRAGP
jgi:hypothetical protein